ncbi:MAG: hypothetical protein AB7Q04_05450 [Steroidobacteraceae bacterium]
MVTADVARERPHNGPNMIHVDGLGVALKNPIQIDQDTARPCSLATELTLILNFTAATWRQTQVVYSLRTALN